MTVARARALRKQMTKAEAVLWIQLRALRPLGFHFRRQAPVGPWVADFLCHAAKLLVEVDGETHGTMKAQARDARRDRWFAEQGYLTLRVTNLDVLENRDGVVERILLILRERTDQASS